MDAHKINDKISAVLSSLDDVKQAGPAPYLHTRVMARLQKSVAPDLWNRASAFLSRPRIAFSGIALFVAVNIFAVIAYNKEKDSTAIAQASGYDFAIHVESIYDIENQEP